MKSSAEQIQSLVDSFVAELTALIYESALAAVHEALGAGVSARAAAPARKATGGRRTAPRAPRKPSAKKGGRRARRSAEDLAAMAEQIVAYVTANPASSMEDLVGALGEDAAVIRRPLNGLLDEGRLRKEGEKRGTRYFAGGGAKKAARKAGKKGKRRASKRAAAAAA